MTPTVHCWSTWPQEKRNETGEVRAERSTPHRQAHPSGLDNFLWVEPAPEADLPTAPDCPPSADPRSRAEAAKALYSLDHPEPTWTQGVIEMPEPVRTDLSGARLGRAPLTNVSLFGANLRGVDLSHADLSGAFLGEVNLMRADLSHADLSHADLSHADLSDADLSYASLARANLSGATLSEASFYGTDLALAKLLGANLRGAILSNTRIFGANFRDADLRDAEFGNTNVLACQFAGASIEGADFTEVLISGTVLGGVSAAAKLLQGEMEAAYGNQETALPGSLEYPCSWEGIQCEPGAKYGEPIREEDWLSEAVADAIEGGE